MLTVAIATENELFDGEVYRALLERILGKPIARWRTDLRFSGWQGIPALAPLFLMKAAENGVAHAIFAIDNDGGARRRPEHDALHDQKAEADKRGDGCRYCWLVERLPSDWVADGRKRAIEVPVQTVETWLLVLRGHAFPGRPEATYDRAALKKSFYGSPFPPQEVRTQMATAEIARPEALDVLRQRPSFRLFESQLQGW